MSLKSEEPLCCEILASRECMTGADSVGVVRRRWVHLAVVSGLFIAAMASSTNSAGAWRGVPERTTPLRSVTRSTEAAGRPTAAPTGVQAESTTQPGQLRVSFTPVPNREPGNGGASLTGHRATCRADGQNSRSATDSTRPYGPIKVSGLTAGVTYSCKVQALNAYGAGPASLRATARVDPPWLTRVNQIRTGSGLRTVTANAAWADGLQKHFIYLHRTPPSYRTGIYANAHYENPASPYYTSEGDAAGRSSNLAFGSSSDVDAINAWLTAPFHAIGILRPGLTQVGFARDALGYAGLDVIRGLSGSSSILSPIQFPGPGASIDLNYFGGESPDPTETCRNLHPGNNNNGLPIVAMLPNPPDPGIAASLVNARGSVTTAGSGLCIVDENHYFTSDPVYGPTGRAILDGADAVLLIPRATLPTGPQTVTITQSGQAPITWSFRVNDRRRVMAPSPQVQPIDASSRADRAVTMS